MDRSPMGNANGVDMPQVILCVLAMLCIAANFPAKVRVGSFSSDAIRVPGPVYVRTTPESYCKVTAIFG